MNSSLDSIGCSTLCRSTGEGSLKVTIELMGKKYVVTRHFNGTITHICNELEKIIKQPVYFLLTPDNTQQKDALLPEYTSDEWERKYEDSPQLLTPPARLSLGERTLEPHRDYIYTMPGSLWLKLGGGTKFANWQMVTEDNKYIGLIQAEQILVAPDLTGWIELPVSADSPES